LTNTQKKNTKLFLKRQLSLRRNLRNKCQTKCLNNLPSTGTRRQVTCLNTIKGKYQITCPKICLSINRRSLISYLHTLQNKRDRCQTTYPNFLSNMCPPNTEDTKDHLKGVTTVENLDT
jgi:hypothetical protein